MYLHISMYWYFVDKVWMTPMHISNVHPSCSSIIHREEDSLIKVVPSVLWATPVTTSGSPSVVQSVNNVFASGSCNGTHRATRARFKIDL
jgi:hypothetical protein